MRQAAIKDKLRLRERINQAIRSFFTERDYLEVETPCRIPAPAPEAHIDAVSTGKWFLQTSPELCMKRLLSAGYHRVFQICKCFRQGERGKRHLPELTMLEWYTAGGDYRQMMEQTEELVKYIAFCLGTGTSFLYQGGKITLDKTWDRMTVAEAFDRLGSMSMVSALSTDRFDELMGCEIEPKLGQNAPVFLYDYPAEIGALARLKPDDRRFAERFELYIGGIELCNSFSELTDPEQQRARFEIERAYRQSHGKTVYPMPEKFLAALSAMPRAAGNALGVDRLAMLFADTQNIDDVVAFTPEEL